MAEATPMSDRRFVLVLVSGFAVVVGLATALLPLPSLAHPMTLTGEGERVDATRLLIEMIAVGALLVAAGTTSAVLLLRRPAP